MPKEIENIIFSRFVKQPVPFEIITIQELYERCKKSAYDLSNPHRIEFHALLVITKGKSTHTVDFKDYPLFPGVILPLIKKQVHSFNKNLMVDGYVISFDEKFITNNVSEKNLFHFLHLFNTPSVLIEIEDLELVLPFITLLENAQRNANNNLKSDFMNSVLMALLLQIKRFTINKTGSLDSQRLKDFIQFKLLVNSHYQESHNASDYAKMLSVSYKYLNDVCKEVSNKTAKAFIDDWLLLEIKRNISENKYTSQEIAYKMGFKDPSNFVRFFKKFTGATPNKFVKES